MIPAAIALDHRVSERDRACSDVRQRLHASARYSTVGKPSLFVQHSAHALANQDFGELQSLGCRWWKLCIHGFGGSRAGIIDYFGYCPCRSRLDPHDTYGLE